MPAEPQWFQGKRVYFSAGGLHLEFYSEAEAQAFLVEGRRNGVTRNWRVGAVVTKPFRKTQPPTITEGVVFQCDLPCD